MAWRPADGHAVVAPQPPAEYWSTPVGVAGWHRHSIGEFLRDVIADELECCGAHACDDAVDRAVITHRLALRLEPVFEALAAPHAQLCAEAK